jgi:hypothetical protein
MSLFQPQNKISANQPEGWSQQSGIINSESEWVVSTDLISSIRSQIKDLTSDIKKGNGFLALKRIEEIAFEDLPEDVNWEKIPQVEGARLLLRFIGDPGLIVQSRHFAHYIGLEHSVELDRAARYLHQNASYSQETLDVMRPLVSQETPIELDWSLPDVSLNSRRALLEPCEIRSRDLPAGNGMSNRRDNLPALRRKVEEGGVGARRFGFPEENGVRPPEPIIGGEIDRVNQILKLVDQYRSNGPRILSVEEIHILAPGRMLPSRSWSLGNTESCLSEHLMMASSINDHAQDRKGFSLDSVKALNTYILSGSEKEENYPVKFHLRDFENCSRDEIFFAPPDLILSFLDDLTNWYDANEDTMHPVKIGALLYQQFVRIHPLPNNNGRIGRAVMDIVLQTHGYPPPSFSRTDNHTISDRTVDVVLHMAQGILLSVEKLSHSFDS